MLFNLSAIKDGRRPWNPVLAMTSMSVFSGLGLQDHFKKTSQKSGDRTDHKYIWVYVWHRGVPTYIELWTLTPASKPEQKGRQASEVKIWSTPDQSHRRGPRESTGKEKTAWTSQFRPRTRLNHQSYRLIHLTAAGDEGRMRGTEPCSNYQTGPAKPLVFVAFLDIDIFTHERQIVHTFCAAGRGPAPLVDSTTGAPWTMRLWPHLENFLLLFWFFDGNNMN